MAKKIVGYIVIIALFIGSFFGIYYAVKYSQVEDSNNIIDDYKQQIEDLTDSNNQKDEYYKEQIALLSADIADLTQQLSETTQQLSEALQDNLASAEIIEELNSSIASLNSQIQEQLEQIKELQLKLDAYTEYEGVAGYATFYVDGSVYDVDVVNLNDGIVEFPSISVEGCNFEGWSLDGVNAIENTENYTIQSDTTFYALLTCDATFSINGSVTSITVPKNTILSSIVPEIEEYEDYLLDGFYVDDVKVGEDSKITQHTTYLAKFRKYIEADFDFNTADDVNKINDAGSTVIAYTLALFRNVPFEFSSLNNKEFHCEITFPNDYKYVIENTTSASVILDDPNYTSTVLISAGELEDGTETFTFGIFFMRADGQQFTEEEIETIESTLFPINVVVYDNELYTEVEV